MVLVRAFGEEAGTVARATGPFETAAAGLVASFCASRFMVDSVPVLVQFPTTNPVTTAVVMTTAIPMVATFHGFQSPICTSSPSFGLAKSKRLHAVKRKTIKPLLDRGDMGPAVASTILLIEGFTIYPREEFPTLCRKDTNTNTNALSDVT